MTYTLFEHKQVKKFFKKHEHDKKLLLRINKKYIEILKNPYAPEFKELTSTKCPKCQRARVGNFRIIFYVSDSNQKIEIINIIPRKSNYRIF